MERDDIRKSIQDGYSEVARRASSCCGPTNTCCGGGEESADQARLIGYSDEELAAIPEDANLGLGCGNPTAIANLASGETVLDLGSGAGMDAFLAASRVGETGQVIGIDMTPEMLARARNAATERGVSHFVEFRRGFIEELPVTDASVDVILSNCVINLSLEKDRVFAEAFRVLKSGGRLSISDICLSGPLPPKFLEVAAGYTACISGAIAADDYEQGLRDAGFASIEVSRKDASFLIDGVCSDPVFADAIADMSDDELDTAREHLWSYDFRAEKP